MSSKKSRRKNDQPDDSSNDDENSVDEQDSALSGNDGKDSEGDSSGDENDQTTKSNHDKLHESKEPKINHEDSGDNDDDDNNGDNDDDDDDDDDDGNDIHDEGKSDSEEDGNDIGENDEDNKIDADANEESKMKRKVHKLSLEKTKDFNKILNKRGVIYIARIPPRMTPTKVKNLLSHHGEVTRVFLQEEDPTVRKRRKKLNGGNAGGKRYIEGWVEMASKKIAKHVARSLHMSSISNHKRNPHYGDLWNLKYLSKFKWSHLTEKVAYERRVREQKIRLETLQARRETQNYKHLVETGKKLDKIEERKRKRAEKQSSKQKNDDNESSQRKKPKVRQLKPMDDGTGQSTRKALLGALVK